MPLTNKTSVLQEFEEKFHKDFKYMHHTGLFMLELDVQSFLSTSLDSLLSTLEAEVEGMKRNQVTGGFEGEQEMNIEIATYNESISDVLAIINKIKE